MRITPKDWFGKRDSISCHACVKQTLPLFLCFLVLPASDNRSNIHEIFLDTFCGPACPPQSATIVLGPSPMESNGARILAAFEPCILTDGTVILNIPEEQGIRLAAANVQGGQTTQSAIIPMQRISTIAQGQTLYSADLTEQIAGLDPITGNPVTLNSNINALFLWNTGGQNVQFSADNSVALNAVLRR